MKNKLIKEVTNKKTIALLMSITIYISLCYQDILPAYNILSFLLIGVIYYAIINTNLNISCKKEIGIISSIFSILLITGRILYYYRYDPIINSIDEILKIQNIVFFFGNLFLFYLILSWIIPRALQYKKVSKNNDSKKIFWITFVILAIIYSIYYIVYYPGILSSDSISEINMILGNELISDHHTIFHVFWMSILFHIANLFTTDINLIIGFITLIQMFIMILILSYSVGFFYKRNVPKWVTNSMILFYAFFSINGFYSITIWKDIMFSCNVLLLTIECIKLLEKNKNISWKNSWTFIIVSILTIVSRNNAFYMYILLAIITLIVLKQKRLLLFIMISIVLICYGIIKGPIYQIYNIKISKSSEYIAIPLQQIGRMAYKNIDFTKEEEAMINDLIPVSVLKEVYSPEIVDPIKFNRNYHNEVFEKNKLKYLKLWTTLCIKHPSTAVEAYLTSTLGYWYPGTEYWVTTAGIDDNSLGIKNSSLIPQKVRMKFTEIRNNEIPIIGYLKCIGFCFWILIILLYLVVKKFKDNSWYIFVPVLGIWGTMFIATPVFSEFRYIYCAYLCLPVFFAYVFSSKKVGE